MVTLNLTLIQCLKLNLYTLYGNFFYNLDPVQARRSLHDFLRFYKRQESSKSGVNQSSRCSHPLDGETQQPFESSLQEENSPDVTGDDLVKELLSYFRELENFKTTEDDIKQKCHIEQVKKVWSHDEIKQAWEKAKSLTKKEKKYWSRVILLQELNRRVCNEKGEGSIPEIVLEEDDDRVKGLIHWRKRHSSERNTNLKMFHDDALQTPGDILKRLSLEEQSRQPPHILIPLSVMSENESTPIKDVGDSTPYPKYKLKDGVPYRKINPSGSEIRKRKSYVMSFNDQTNNADWTYEILNRSTLAENSLVLKNIQDYEKGHLAAAANHRWCFEAQDESSLYSNITPQHIKLNRGVWKTLEKHCRDTAENTGYNVHVYSGPLYINPTGQTMGGKHLPTHLFKVMIVEDNNGIVTELECYEMPNETIDNSKQFSFFKVDIGTIEKDSGLTFVELAPTTTISKSMKTIQWEGNDADGQLRTARIEVRISP